jgi:L,D-transpeptidase ErfK/SrfK
VYTFPLGIGREGWGSPIANTRITAKTPNPTWTPPASIRKEHAADGDILPPLCRPAGQPAGAVQVHLGVPGYLIHGSNKKFGIGMRTSHGCFRMLNNNVLEMSKMVPVNTPVRIINEPYKFGSVAAKSISRRTPLDDQGNPSVVDKHTAVINALLKREDLANNLRMNWDMVRDVVAAEDGMPVEIAVPVNGGAHRWSRAFQPNCSKPFAVVVEACLSAGLLFVHVSPGNKKADPQVGRLQQSRGLLLAAGFVQHTQSALVSFVSSLLCF